MADAGMLHSSEDGKVEVEVSVIVKLKLVIPALMYI